MTSRPHPTTLVDVGELDDVQVDYRVEPDHALYEVLVRACRSGFTLRDDLTVEAEPDGQWVARLTGPDIGANYGSVPDPLMMVGQLLTDPDEAFLFGLRNDGVYEATISVVLGGMEHPFSLRYQHSPEHGPLRIRVVS